MTEAVAGHDAVIVCLGSTGLRDKTTLATGTATIVAAAARHEVERPIVVSAAGVGDSWAQIPWSSKLLFKTMLRNLFADHRTQEAIVEQSPTKTMPCAQRLMTLVPPLRIAPRTCGL